MVFSDLPFLFFFLPVVLAVYYCIPRKLKNGWLLLSSLFFYSFGEPVFLILMVFSIAWNYLCGIFIQKYSSAKKVWLILCIAVNLALLGFFKYAMFLMGTLKTFLPFLSVPAIALPIGISFYTFQTMSYVIDVYRGECKAQKNIVTFATYVALFPQLIAGPIVRYVDVETQLVSRQETPELFAEGVRLFLIGLCKKLLLANPMGALFESLRASSGTGTLGMWFGVAAFTLQIYFDFGGYSDMARGLGNFFGFRFVKNFDYPYISRSVTEFWRRWHISLGTWFREYVYIPLGGNRKGKWKHIRNICVVWLLTGIWHGAAWNFILWGVYFALLLLAEKFFLLRWLKKTPRFVQHLYALFFIVIGWSVFSADTVGETFSFWKTMFTLSKTEQNVLVQIVAYLPTFLLAVLSCVPVWKSLWYRVRDKKWFRIAEAVAAVAVLLLCGAVMVSSTYNPFLYYRF